MSAGIWWLHPHTCLEIIVLTKSLSCEQARTLKSGVFDVDEGGRGGPARDELVRPRGGVYCLEEVVLLIN